MNPYLDAPAAARRVLAAPAFVCLEEPEDPITWATVRNDGAPADRGYVADLCARDHPELPCGYFRLVPAAPDRPVDYLEAPT